MKRTVNARKAKRRRQTTRQLFRLSKELHDLAKTLRRPIPAFPTKESVKDTNETDILLELYHGNYFPQSHFYEKNDPLNKNARETLDALYATLSPEQKDLYMKYEAAENARGAALSERAYKDGFRLAVQLILAGRSEAVETE